MNAFIRAEHGGATAVGPSLVWPLGLVGMTIAWVANVGLYETAIAAGVSFRMRGQVDVFETFQQLTTGFRSIEVTNVFIDTVMPFLIGLALFSLALRRSRIVAVAVLVAGVVLAIATIAVPMSLERMPAHARDLLARMHLVTGALFAASVLPALIVNARAASGREHEHEAVTDALDDAPA